MQIQSDSIKYEETWDEYVPEAENLNYSPNSCRKI